MSACQRGLHLFAISWACFIHSHLLMALCSCSTSLEIQLGKTDFSLLPLEMQSSVFPDTPTRTEPSSEPLAICHIPSVYVFSLQLHVKLLQGRFCFCVNILLSYNSHTNKSTHLKHTIPWVSVYLCNYHCSARLQHCHASKEKFISP